MANPQKPITEEKSAPKAPVEKSADKQKMGDSCGCGTGAKK